MTRQDPKADTASRLDRLERGCRARIAAIDTSAGSVPQERARQFVELGFLVGEPVAVVAHAWPGGDPLVVAVGSSRFALRRAEAACIVVEPLA